MVVPSWHTSHLDAVFEDPEKFGGAVERSGFCQIGGQGIKAPRDVALRYAGCAVADSAMRREMLDAVYDFRRVVEPRRDFNTGGMRLDRASARRFQRPARDPQCGAVAATS